MEKWTIERLYELWRNRGYSKKAAKNMAEKDYEEMYREKSLDEQYEIMQEMISN